LKALSIVSPLNGTPNFPFLYEALISAFTPTSGFIRIRVCGLTLVFIAAFIRLVIPLKELTTILVIPFRKT
jgi:hypothetical protein